MKQKMHFPRICSSMAAEVRVVGTEEQFGDLKMEATQFENLQIEDSQMGNPGEEDYQIGNPGEEDSQKEMVDLDGSHGEEHQENVSWVEVQSGATQVLLISSIVENHLIAFSTADSNC